MKVKMSTTISGNVNQLVENNDYIGSDTNEREEWMILADLKLKGDNKSKKHMDCYIILRPDIPKNKQQYLKTTIQEMGNMPHWIKMQNNSNTLKNYPTPNPVDIKKFNDAQKVAYKIAQDHFACISERKEQLLMIITGLRDSGKSFVLHVLSNLLNRK